MGRRSDARQRILDSALRLMNQRGYTGVAVDDIMREANVGKSSFYHFFESKDALGEEVMSEYARRWAEEVLNSAFHPQFDPLERPLQFVNRLAQQLDQCDPVEGLFPATHAANEGVTEPMRSCARDVFRLSEHRFAQAFQQAIAEHDLMPNAQPQQLAKACVAYVAGLMLLCRAQASSEPMRELGPLVQRMWEPYLA